MKRIERKEFDVVLVIAHVLHLATGGDHEVTRLATRLVRDGFSVGIIYLRNPEKHLLEIIEDKGLEKYLKQRPLIHSVYYTVLATWFGFHMVVPVLRRILKIDFRENYSGVDVYFLKNLDIDIKSRTIIAQSFEPAFFVDALKFTGSKFYRVHHSFDDPSFSGELSDLAARSFHLPLKKIVENDTVEARFKKEDPIRIHIGIDTEKFPCLISPETREPTILVPLRRNKSKGSKYGIEAMVMIHSEFPSLRMLSFGNIPKDDVPDFVDYRGVVSFEELINLYNEASITVIPSIVEGTSLPALEAMNCGSAVVSTNNEGVDSFAVNDHDAILVPVGDSRAIADAVISLLNDDSKRLALARNGMKSAKRFSYDRSYRELIEGIGLKPTGKSSTDTAGH